MSKIIKPTVGRIVYYHHAKAGAANNGTPTVTVEGPLAAIVTRVWGPACVNVAVQNVDGAGAFGRTSLRLVQPGEARPALGEWVEWMPYQIEQAERAPTLNQLADANATLATAKSTAAMVDAGVHKAIGDSPSAESIYVTIASRIRNGQYTKTPEGKFVVEGIVNAITDRVLPKFGRGFSVADARAVVNEVLELLVEVRFN